MAILTAHELKARETPEFTIDLGGGREVLARVPDIQLLVLKGILQTPLLNDVIKMVGAWVGTPLADLTEETINSSETLLQFVDTLVCASLVSPKAVRTEPERHDVDTLLASDLTVQTKKVIVIAVTNRMANPEVVAAAKEFPGGGPGEGTGPDVPALQAAAV